MRKCNKTKAYKNLSFDGLDIDWDINNPASTPYSTDFAIKQYVAAGVTSSKIVIGMPIYSRSFEATAGLGKPFTGIGSGTWENGEMISYDTPVEISTKSEHCFRRRSSCLWASGSTGLPTHRRGSLRVISIRISQNRRSN
ncbi:hypothetical protein V496_01547 [Pseudogymnoascus sp. VKM F-4515 (FW-2607)]|nr:hypothetical protein V496_01547 [Pseudogymnoascus sp. VKM F-4515 (FW-2607)]